MGLQTGLQHFAQLLGLPVCQPDEPHHLGMAGLSQACPHIMEAASSFKKKEVYTVRRHDGSLCTQKQPEIIGYSHCCNRATNIGL